MKKRMPDALKIDNEVYIKSKTIEKEFKRYTKAAIADFKRARNESVAELWDSGEDIDIRLETEYTTYTVKNLQVFSKKFLEHFKIMLESFDCQWTKIDGEKDGGK